MVLKFSRYASQMKPYICFFPREAAVLLICHFCLKNNFISVVFNYFYEMFHNNCVKNNLRAVDFVSGKRTLKLPKTFGNKARGRILKTGATGTQNMPNFPKNVHFLPPDTHTHVLRFTLLPYYQQNDPRKNVLPR